jgi:hypothetical protein
MLVVEVAQGITGHQAQPVQEDLAAVAQETLQVQSELLAQQTQAVAVVAAVIVLWAVTAAPVSSSSNTVHLLYLFMYSVEQPLGLHLQVQPRWITW